MNAVKNTHVTFEVPNQIVGGQAEKATGLIVKEHDNMIMVDVLVTSGSYIGQVLSFIKTQLNKQ